MRGLHDDDAAPGGSGDWTTINNDFRRTSKRLEQAHAFLLASYFVVVLLSQLLFKGAGYQTQRVMIN